MEDRFYRVLHFTGSLDEIQNDKIQNAAQQVSDAFNEAHSDGYEFLLQPTPHMFVFRKRADVAPQSSPLHLYAGPEGKTTPILFLRDDGNTIEIHNVDTVKWETNS